MTARPQGLKLSILVVFSAVLLMPLQIHAAETTQNGEWICDRSESDGRWSCRREGAASGANDDTQSEATASELADEAPEAERQVDQAPAPAYVEPQIVQEDVVEAARTSLPDPVMPDESNDLAIAEPVSEPDVINEPAPQAQSKPPQEVPPAPAPAYDPVQSGAFDERPNYQRLAYVPDKPTSLLQLPPNFWVAQLMAVSSKEFLEEYAAEHKLRGLSAARVASGDRLFYVLILGIYENKDLAQRAIADLPPPYDKYNPFLRSLKSLQQAMQRADELAGSAQF